MAWVSGAAAVGGDDDGVLDADATVLGKVHAGLDGDHVAGRERSIGRPADTRGSSWISSPTPWPVPWGRRRAQPASAMTSRGRRASTSAPLTPAATAATPAAWAATTTSSMRALRRRRLADRDRAGHVGAVAVDQGAEVDDDEVALARSTRPTRAGGGAWRRSGPTPTMVSKRVAVGAEAADLGVELEAELALGRPSRSIGSTDGERRRRRCRGRLDAGHLAVVLHAAAAPRPARSVGTSSASANHSAAIARAAAPR